RVQQRTERQHGVRLLAEGQRGFAAAVEDARRGRLVHPVTQKRGVRLPVAVEVADGQEGPVLLDRELHRRCLGETPVRAAVELAVGREQVFAEEAESDVGPVYLRDELVMVRLRGGQVERVEPAEAA